MKQKKIQVIRQKMNNTIILGIPKIKNRRDLVMKRIISLLCAVFMFTCTLTACNQESVTPEEDIVILQLEDINEENPIVTMTIKDYGDIVIELFPDEAPLAVENFIALIEEGYYDGISFHRIIDDFMIQSGDPTATGEGGESIWDEAFEDEFSDNLYCLNGALAMANSGDDDNGSQFFIIQTNDSTADEYDLSQSSTANETEGRGRVEWGVKATEAYRAIGGAPWLDGKHTVFGQVREGLSLITKIQLVETDDSDKPIEDVIIEKVTVSY